MYDIRWRRHTIYVLEKQVLLNCCTDECICLPTAMCYMFTDEKSAKFARIVFNLINAKWNRNNLYMYISMVPMMIHDLIYGTTN